MSYFDEIGSFTPDNLVAGDMPIAVKPVLLATGQGTLARGTVLGKSPVNSKFYKVDVALEPIVKRTLQCTGETTKTAVLALAGLTASTLVVRVGDENGALCEAGADKDYTAAYSNGTLTITVIDAGKLDGVAQCYIEISKAAAGANVADCILTDEVVTGTEADVKAEAYTSGMFNRLAVIVAAGDAIANHEDTLRSKGIFLKDNLVY